MERVTLTFTQDELQTLQRALSHSINLSVGNSKHRELAFKLRDSIRSSVSIEPKA